MSLMMHRWFALLLLFAVLPASAIEYQPVIWPLRDGLIAPFEMAGKVKVTNAEPSTEVAVVYKYGVSMKSNYNAITQVMAEQLDAEIAKNGRAVEGPDKTIDIKVVHLLSKYKFFYWNSTIRFEAKLGNGVLVSREVPHGSGNVVQDLNGCIAEGVMVLLNEPEVREYLSQRDTGAPPALPAAEVPAEVGAIQPPQPSAPL